MSRNPCHFPQAWSVPRDTRLVGLEKEAPSKTSLCFYGGFQIRVTIFVPLRSSCICFGSRDPAVWDPGLLRPGGRTRDPTRRDPSYPSEPLHESLSFVTTIDHSIEQAAEGGISDFSIIASSGHRRFGVKKVRGRVWSGREDLNLRLLAPKASALARLSYAP